MNNYNNERLFFMTRPSSQYWVPTNTYYTNLNQLAPWCRCFCHQKFSSPKVCQQTIEWTADKQCIYWIHRYWTQTKFNYEHHWVYQTIEDNCKYIKTIIGAITILYSDTGVKKSPGSLLIAPETVPYHIPSALGNSFLSKADWVSI